MKEMISEAASLFDLRKITQENLENSSTMTRVYLFPERV
jgi:hypothetical protein